VVREQPLEERLRVRARSLDLAHVRDVEEAGLRAHRDVLLADALVLHRHLPAGEGHELRAEGAMALEKRGTTKSLRGGGHAGTVALPTADCRLPTQSFKNDGTSIS